MGCKLTIVEDQYDDVMAEDFWPERIECREWEVRSRQNNDDERPEG